MWHKAKAWTSRSEVQGVNRLPVKGFRHLWFPFISSTVHVRRKTILWPKFHVKHVQMLAYIASVSFLPCLLPILITLLSLPSSPGRSGGGAGKGRRACNYVSGIWISASKKVDAKCRLVEMTLVMTSLPLACVFSVCLHPCSFKLCAYWRNLTVTAQSTGSHRGIGGGIQITETFLQALLPSFLPYRLQ